MKRFTPLLTALVFCSLIIFVSCKKKKGTEDPDPRDEFGSVLNKVNWTPTVVKLGEATRSEWGSFVLGFTYDTETNRGTYSTSGVPADDGADAVWGDGVISWEFGETNGVADISKIVRLSDGIEMSVTATPPTDPEELNITFNNAEEARVAGFEGGWNFTFIKNSN